MSALDTFVFEKEVRDLMRDFLAEDSEREENPFRPRLPAPNAGNGAARPLSRPSPQTARTPEQASFYVEHNPFSPLARCSIFIFDEGTPEYAYFTLFPEQIARFRTNEAGKTVPVPIRHRFELLERIGKIGNHAPAVRVWLNDTQIEALNNACQNKIQATSKES